MPGLCEKDQGNAKGSDGVNYFHFGNSSDIRKIVGGVGMTKNEEYCEWKDAVECFDNTEFKIQCEFNPLKRGIVPNNFAHHNFKFCPFCGRRIKWV